LQWKGLDTSDHRQRHLTWSHTDLSPKTPGEIRDGRQIDGCISASLPMLGPRNLGGGAMYSAWQ
jgi:hypothetical protein